MLKWKPPKVSLFVHRKCYQRKLTPESKIRNIIYDIGKNIPRQFYSAAKRTRDSFVPAQRIGILSLNLLPRLSRSLDEISLVSSPDHNGLQFRLWLLFPRILIRHFIGSFPHLLECSMWSSYVPFHSQPLLVQWMSSLAVIPWSTMFTFSVVSLGISLLYWSGIVVWIPRLPVLLDNPGNRNGHTLGLVASWLRGFENKEITWKVTL